MKLKDLGPNKNQLIEKIIRNRKKIYFRSWASEVRKIISVSEKTSEFLWAQFLDQSKEVWENYRHIFSECSVKTLREIAAKEAMTAKTFGQVIDMKDYQKEMER